MALFNRTQDTSPGLPVGISADDTGFVPEPVRKPPADEKQADPHAETPPQDEPKKADPAAEAAKAAEQAAEARKKQAADQHKKDEDAREKKRRDKRYGPGGAWHGDPLLAHRILKQRTGMNAFHFEHINMHAGRLNGRHRKKGHPERVENDVVLETMGGGKILYGTHERPGMEPLVFWGKRMLPGGKHPPFNKHDARAAAEGFRAEHSRPGDDRPITFLSKNTLKMNDLLWDAVMEQNLQALQRDGLDAKFIRVANFEPFDMDKKIDALLSGQPKDIQKAFRKHLYPDGQKAGADADKDIAKDAAIPAAAAAAAAGNPLTRMGKSMRDKAGKLFKKIRDRKARLKKQAQDEQPPPSTPPRLPPSSSGSPPRRDDVPPPGPPPFTPQIRVVKPEEARPAAADRLLADFPGRPRLPAAPAGTQTAPPRRLGSPGPSGSFSSRALARRGLRDTRLSGPAAPVLPNAETPPVLPKAQTPPALPKTDTPAPLPASFAPAALPPRAGPPPPPPKPDEKYRDALARVQDKGVVSVQDLRNVLGVGENRALKILGQLEARGIIDKPGPDGTWKLKEAAPAPVGIRADDGGPKLLPPAPPA